MIESFCNYFMFILLCLIFNSIWRHLRQRKTHFIIYSDPMSNSEIWRQNCFNFYLTIFIYIYVYIYIYIYIYIYSIYCIYCIYTGAGHIIRISSKSWFISLIPFKKWNLYNVYIHSTQTDIFQVFISFNFDDYNWQLMKTPNFEFWILWKGSILKTPGATL